MTRRTHRTRGPGIATRVTRNSGANTGRNETFVPRPSPIGNPASQIFFELRNSRIKYAAPAPQTATSKSFWQVEASIVHSVSSRNKRPHTTLSKRCYRHSSLVHRR